MIYDIQHVLNVPVLEKLFFLFCFIFAGFTVALYLSLTTQTKIQNFTIQLIEKLPMKEKFLKLYHSIQLYGKSPKLIFQILAISLIAQTTSIFFFAMAGHASGLDAGIPLSTYFLVSPLGFMATAIPISPAGVGVGQAAFDYLFNVYLGHSSEIGTTVITAFQMFQFLFGLIGIVFYLQMKERIKLPEAGLEVE